MMFRRLDGLVWLKQMNLDVEKEERSVYLFGYPETSGVFPISKMETHSRLVCHFFFK